MAIPFIQRSLRWKLALVTSVIIVSFAVILTAIHIRAQNALLRQVLKDQLSQKQNELEAAGQMRARELQVQLEYELMNDEIGMVADILRSALSRYPDMIHLRLTEYESGRILARASQADHHPDIDLAAMLRLRQPIHVGSQIWGTLDLEFSLTQLNLERARIEQEMERATRSVVVKSLSTSATFLVISVLFILVASGRLTHPLIQLTHTAEAFARGNFAATTGIKASSSDEVGKLSQAFIKMADELRQNYDQLKMSTEEARRSEAFLDTILDNLPYMIFVKDARDLTFLRINKAGEAATGRSREFMIGKNDFAFFPHEQAAFFTRKDREVLEGGRRVDIIDEPLSRQDGTIRYLHTVKVPIFDSAGNTQYLLGMSQDITEEKSIAEERTLFFNHSIDMLCIATMDGYFEQVNPTFAAVTGYTQEELCACPYLDFLHPDDVESTLAVMKALNVGENVFAFQNRYRCKDGNYRWLTWSARINFDLKKIFAIARDVTEQKKMEEMILQAGQREQERIARDLHDGLGQILTGLAYKAKFIEQMLARGEVPEPGKAADIVRLANQASERARALARGLDPVLLRDDLPAALEVLANSTMEMFPVQCSVELESDDPIDGSVANHLYRIAQEAVTNAIKHGKARNITIHLASNPHHIRLMIIDDGSGAGNEITLSKGLGIHTMNFRAKLIGGVLSVMPGPHGGVLIRCAVDRSPEQSATVKSIEV